MRARAAELSLIIQLEKHQIDTRRHNCEQTLDMIFSDHDSEGENVPCAFDDTD